MIEKLTLFPENAERIRASVSSRNKIVSIYTLAMHRAEGDWFGSFYDEEEEAYYPSGIYLPKSVLNKDEDEEYYETVEVSNFEEFDLLKYLPAITGVSVNGRRAIIFPRRPRTAPRDKWFLLEFLATISNDLTFENVPLIKSPYVTFRGVIYQLDVVDEEDCYQCKHDLDKQHWELLSKNLRNRTTNQKKEEG